MLTSNEIIKRLSEHEWGVTLEEKGSRNKWVHIAEIYHVIEQLELENNQHD